MLEALPPPKQPKGFTPAQMMGQAESFALSKASKSSSMTLGLAIMAGLFIGLAFVFYVTVTTGAPALPWGVNRLLGGLVFSTGLMLIVVCGGELFTSTVLSLIAYANRELSLSQLLGAWGKVYIGNIIGASLLVLLVSMAALYQLDHGLWGLNVLHIAQHKLHHTPVQAFTLGVLCNLMVCLAIWLTFSSDNPGAKAALVIMPVALFVSTGFEHCVANMFMVPMGIAVKTFAGPEFWAQVGVSPAEFADLTFANFLQHNLLPVTLGNIVGGGVLVGLGYWFIFRRCDGSHATATTLNHVLGATQATRKDSDMKYDVIQLSEVMDSAPVLLRPELPLTQAIAALRDAGVDGAPVVDADARLQGYLSQHDLLVELWCRNYARAEAPMTVAELMQTDVAVVKPGDSLLQLAEYMAIDHDAVFPVSDAGYATSLSHGSAQDRARSQVSKQPKSFPVVQGNRVVGVINRTLVLDALKSLFGQLETVKAEVA